MDLIEGGFVEAFEETLCVVDRRAPEESRDRQRNLREDFDQMGAFVDMLKKSEDAERTGELCENKYSLAGTRKPIDWGALSISERSK